MKGYKKKVTISALVVLFLFASILCCCVIGDAHVGSDYKTANLDKSEYHSHKKKNAGSENGKECNCEIDAVISSSNGLNLSKDGKSFNRLLENQFYAIYETSFFNRLVVRSVTSQESNQLFKNSIPIYLKDSVLRL